MFIEERLFGFEMTREDMVTIQERAKKSVESDCDAPPGCVHEQQAGQAVQVWD